MCVYTCVRVDFKYLEECYNQPANFGQACISSYNLYCSQSEVAHVLLVQNSVASLCSEDLKLFVGVQGLAWSGLDPHLPLAHLSPLPFSSLQAALLAALAHVLFFWLESSFSLVNALILSHCGSEKSGKDFFSPL